MPSIETLIRKFRGKHYITTLDMKSGYWHIPIKESDRAKTAFAFDGKLWEWCVMPFGPTNAPPYFQKVMNDIFSDLPYVLVYLDDISILSNIWDLSIKTTNILYLYTKHLISTTLKSKSIEIHKSDASFHILQTAPFNPSILINETASDVIGESDDESNDSQNDSNTSTTNNNIPKPKQKRYSYQSDYLKPYDYDNYIFASKPTIHKSPPKCQTRFVAKQQRLSNLKRATHEKLIPITNVSGDSKIEQTNDKIIQNKPSKPTYNKSLLIPPKASIADRYNLNNISNDAIKEKQSNDPRLFAIITYLKENNKYLLTDLNKYVYRTVLSGRFYINHNDILMYKYNERNCIVIPDSLISSVLYWAHDDVHHGYQRMIARISDRY